MVEDTSIIIVNEFQELLKISTLALISDSEKGKDELILIFFPFQAKHQKADCEVYSVYQNFHVIGNIQNFYDSILYVEFLKNVEKHIFDFNFDNNEINLPTKKYSVIPIRLFSQPIGFLLFHGTDSSQFTLLCETLNSQLLILNLLNSFKVTFQKLNSQEELNEVFVETITHLLNVRTTVRKDAKTGDKTLKISLRDNDASIKISNYDAPLLHLEVILKHLYDSIYKNWEHVYTNKHAQELSQKIEQINPLIQEFNQQSTLLDIQLKRKLQQQSDYDSSFIQTPYSFYKGSSDWVIYFDNEVVRLSRKLNKGLGYIHKLLTNPKKSFYPNELELSYKRSGSGKFIEIAQDWSVNVSSIFQSHKAGSEAELLKSLRNIQEEKPDLHDPINDHIQFWSYILYLSDELLSIVSKRTYIELHQTARQELEDKIIELQTNSNDKHFIRKILSESKIIKKAEDFQETKRKVYQRVTKAMKNAIKSMDSEDIQQYFSETIIIGNKSIYSPQKSTTPIDWKLEI